MPGLGTFSFASCGQFERFGQVKACSYWRAQGYYSVTLSAIVSFHEVTVRAKSRHVRRKRYRKRAPAYYTALLHSITRFVNFPLTSY